MELLDHIFGAKDPILWWQEVARAMLILTYALVAMRLVGRRLIGRWSALDFAVSIIIGSNLSRALTGNAPLWGTLAATTVVLLLHSLLAHGAARSRLLSRLVEGGPIELMKGARLDVARCKRAAISKADINEALRSAGLESAEGARQIMFEPSGELVVLKR